ncbi:MAG: protein translocase subunit SecD [bacterium]|nr:protein translocase subunit SecD [bacterium]
MKFKSPAKALMLMAIVALSAYFISTIPLNYGLDLKGGTRLVLQLKDTENLKVDANVVRDVKEVMRNRVDGLGITEPLLQVKGNRDLIVELPGIKDARKAADMLQTLAMMEFRHIPSEWKNKMQFYTDDSGQVVYKFMDDGKEVPLAQVLQDSPPVITGGNLQRKQISAQFDQNGNPIVSFALDKEGAKKFRDFTTRNVGETLAIVLDNKIISAPNVNEPITEGRGQISGGFKTLEEAQDLAVLLKGGSLPVPVEIVENRTIGPTLGQESISKSKTAAIIGIAAVALFMLTYYTVPGLLANLALIVYTLLVMAIMAGLHATLTLPGIAGIILSVGMAVDANIIIFERIREELRTGKALRSAVNAGFKRAFTTILDSNVTTLIAAVVLFIWGTGPIKGFAVTLSLGILVSMFTAIVVNRYFIDLFSSLKRVREKNLYFRI